MNAQTEITHQQELELLAEWLGIKIDKSPYNGGGTGNTGFDICGNAVIDWHNGKVWNPSPEGNDTDFLNMVAGRVDIEFYPRLNPVKAIATTRVGLSSFIAGRTFDLYNNDKVAAMKHAAYQVCLMAAREGKENG